MDVLQLTFMNTNTVRDKKKSYTTYEIEVKSLSTINWIIYKRYSDFYALHQQLLKIALGKRIELHLPQKRFLGLLASGFVETRRKELQEYLTQIIRTSALALTDPVLNFLEVPDTVRSMLIRSPNTPKVAEFEARTPTKDMGHLTEIELRVHDFLKALKQRLDRVQVLQEFEEYYFEQKPRLSPQLARVLFQGTKHKDDAGLVETSGDFAYSHVSARTAFSFFCRLLDPERTKDSSLFVEVLCTLSVRSLARLQLHVHILSERGTRLQCYRLLALIQKVMPQIEIEAIVADPRARREHLGWSQHTSYLPVKDQSPDTTKEGVVHFNPDDYQHLLGDCFHEVLDIAKQDNNGWKSVRSIRPPIEDPVELEFRAGQKDKLTLRAHFTLPGAPMTVLPFLADLRLRKRWDTFLMSGHLVSELGNATDLVHMIIGATNSPHQPRDTCLLRGTAAVDDKLLAVVMSVVHPSVPEAKQHMRCTLFPTGYFLSPSEDNLSTRVVFVGQFDKKAALVYSMDLLGEGFELSSSFQRLSKLLTTQVTRSAPPGATSAPCRPQASSRSTSSSSSSSSFLCKCLETLFLLFRLPFPQLQG